MSRAEKRAAKREARSGRRGGFLLGAIAGALVGVLVAPKSGKETRAQILGSGDDFGGQVDRIKGALEAGKEQAAGQSEALRRKIEGTRERLRREMESGDGQSEEGADETTSDSDEPI